MFEAGQLPHSLVGDRGGPALKSEVDAEVDSSLDDPGLGELDQGGVDRDHAGAGGGTLGGGWFDAVAGDRAVLRITRDSETEGNPCLQLFGPTGSTVVSTS